MQSMFEGCSSFSTITINGFITKKVQYMNKMFKDCTSLISLEFKYLTTESLGTMYQMFYNCQNLKYLNLYSLTESGQSLQEMFDGSSYSFELCIYDERNIPNIFKELLKSEIKRNCSDACYNDGINRINIPSKKLCCTKYAYND
jgi:surface protein